jgi:hypothetical protein
MSQRMKDTKEIVQLRQALINVQWACCDHCGNHWFCPTCGSPSPEWATQEDLDENVKAGTHLGNGHKVGCEVGLALQG